MRTGDLKVAGYRDWNYQPWAFTVCSFHIPKLILSLWDSVPFLSLPHSLVLPFQTGILLFFLS